MAAYGRAENLKGRHAMTDKQHESQRSLVELSLRLCPEGGRHKGKRHEAKLADHDEH